MSTLTSALDLYERYIDPLEKITDGYIQLQSRLNAVNDGLQTQAKLQDKVFAAANRSRNSYSEMVSTFANLQASASDVFGSNSETLAFSELMQKSFKLGGADTETQSAGIDQVIQSMGSGKIDGSAFDAITANAPMMLEAMETFTGKSKAELQSMAEEGTLTADILKNSMFAASAGIDNEFSNMPMTFADIWNRIKNAALEAFGGVIESISNIINSDGFQTFLNVVIAGIYAIASVLDWIIDTTTKYFDYLAPILEVIGGVLLVTIIADLWAAAAAVWAAVAAFIIANWTIICIVAAIVIVITMLNAMGVTAQEVFGFIGGAVWGLVAIVYDAVALIANFFIFIFKAIDGGITDLVNGAIDFINTLIKASNLVFGTEFEQISHSETFFDAMGLDYMELKDPREAYKEGSNAGGEVYNGAKNKLDNAYEGVDSLLSNLTSGSQSDLGTNNNPITVQGVGSNGTLGVDMAEEDIQYLRDIAERDYINKFSTSTVAPNIQVSFGDVHQEADADKVAGRIQRILQEQIATAGEGVY